MSQKQKSTSIENEQTRHVGGPEHAKTVAGHPGRVESPKQKDAPERQSGRHDNDEDVQEERPELAPGGGTEPRQQDGRH